MDEIINSAKLQRDAERQQRRRRRRKMGRRVYQIEGDEVLIEQMLRALRYRFDGDDPRDTGRALQEFLGFLAGEGRHT
jgi:hypothetical protein